jgi:hypothetical protein
MRAAMPELCGATAPDISGYVGQRSGKILEDKFFVEVLHVPNVLFFHQEKSFQDL